MNISCHKKCPESRFIYLIFIIKPEYWTPDIFQADDVLRLKNSGVDTLWVKFTAILRLLPITIIIRESFYIVFIVVPGLGFYEN